MARNCKGRVCIRMPHSHQRHGLACSRISIRLRSICPVSSVYVGSERRATGKTSEHTWVIFFPDYKYELQAPFTCSFWFLLFPFCQWYRKLFDVLSPFPMNTYTGCQLSLSLCNYTLYTVYTAPCNHQNRQAKSVKGRAAVDALYRMRTTTTNGLCNFPFVWNLNSSFLQKLSNTFNRFVCK